MQLSDSLSLLWHYLSLGLERKLTFSSPVATKCSTWVQSQKWLNDLCSFPFNITVIQVYVPTRNAKKAEVEQFYDDLQDLLELTPKKRYPFHHRGQACKSRSEEIPGITGKFGPGVQSEVGQRIIRFYQENALFMENAIFQQRKGWPDMDITRCSIWKSDWLYTLQPKMKNLYKVSKNKIGSEL